MMGYFNTGQPESEPAGDSNVGPGNSGLTADVDLGLGNVSLPSVDADVCVGDLNLPSVEANVSLLAGDCDGSGLINVGNSGAGLDVNVGDSNGDGLQIDVVTPDSLLSTRRGCSMWPSVAAMLTAHQMAPRHRGRGPQRRTPTRGAWSRAARRHHRWCRTRSNP